MPPRTVDSSEQATLTCGLPVVSTHADDSAPLTDSARRVAWQRCIDEKLIEWGANPELFDDEDFDFPSHKIIKLAIDAATQMRDADALPPHRVVHDASGGIVFERLTGTKSTKIHIWNDGSIELIVLDAGRVTYRRKVT
jgi:hypothetical protein